MQVDVPSATRCFSLVKPRPQRSTQNPGHGTTVSFLGLAALVQIDAYPRMAVGKRKRRERARCNSEGLAARLAFVLDSAQVDKAGVDIVSTHLLSKGAGREEASNLTSEVFTLFSMSKAAPRLRNIGLEPFGDIAHTLHCAERTAV